MHVGILDLSRYTCTYSPSKRSFCMIIHHDVWPDGTSTQICFSHFDNSYDRPGSGWGHVPIVAVTAVNVSA